MRKSKRGVVKKRWEIQKNISIKTIKTATTKATETTTTDDQVI